MKYLFILFALLLIKVNNTTAQIKWNLIDDTVTLSPNIITGVGDVTIQQGKAEPLQVSGVLAIILNAKTVILNNAKDVFNLKDKELSELELNGFGRFQHEDLFQDAFKDSLYRYYRKTLYPIIELNQISLDISRRTQYSLEDTGLTLKNQKLLSGKLCYVDLDNLIVLDENGELHNLKDGDFNFFVFNGFKDFSCKGLYNYIFIDYKERLIEHIEEWKERIKKKSVEDLIETFGAIDKIINISPDKKMISWQQNMEAYNISLSSHSSRLTYVADRSYTQVNSLFTNISNFFLYGNVGITSTTNTTIVNSTSTFQSGTISSKDVGYSLIIIQDASNKTIQVYQHNIFSNPSYGMAFSFITR
jgi:hypothetical protein